MSFKLIPTKQITELRQLWENTFAVMRVVWKKYPGLCIGISIIGVLVAFVPFARSAALALLIDSLVASTDGELSTGVILGAAFLILASFIPTVLFVIRNYFDKRIWMRMQEYFEMLFLRKKGSLDVARLEDPEFNDTLNTASERSAFPMLNLAEAQFANIENVLQVIIAAIILFAFDWYYLVIIIIGTLPEFFIRVRYGKNIWGIFSSNAEERRRYYSMRSQFDHKKSLLELKIFQNAHHFVDLMTTLVRNFNDKQLREERNKAIFSSVGALIALTSFGIVISLAVSEVLNGDMTVGTLTFFIGSVASFSAAVSGFLRIIASQSEQSSFVTDIFKVLNAEEIVSDPENPKTLNLDTVPEITFENVSFHYPNNDELVLKNLNFTIKPGERIALIGVNGAGKTTLTKLLARYYDPTHGRILINGIDLREVHRDEWYKSLTILSQDYATYESFAAEDMIALGNTTQEINMGQVEKAAQMSEATSFVNMWPDKFKQVIGKQFQGGVDPSQGQLQRLALARAYYRNPKVLVLDEPTSSVDADAESKIFESIERLPRDHTLILISHRFSTVRSADTICVIKDGEIAEQGSHKELVDQDGLYAELFKKQARGYQ